VCTPIAALAGSVASALRAAPNAVVADAGSVKSRVVSAVAGLADRDDLPRFVGSPPMGGTERSGPEHPSASLVDGIAWAGTRTQVTPGEAVGGREAWIDRMGGRPVRLGADRHDRLVAFASHLPQVASTSLMGLAAAEESGEPEILLLAAGG